GSCAGLGGVRGGGRGLCGGARRPARLRGRRAAAALGESPGRRLYPPVTLHQMTRLRFRVDARAGGSRARASRFHTLHGEVLTPVFMPVATRATVRGLSVEDLQAAGSTVLLANAYHLLLRPGPEVFARL